MTPVPEEVTRLAAERDERRRARDFAAADAIRDRIHALGYEITDVPEGFELAPLPPARLLRPHEVASVLDSRATSDVSVHWLAEEWPQDILRGLDSFRRFEGSRSVHHVVVETRTPPPGTWPPDVEVVPLTDAPGFGAARNAGLVRSTGRIVLVVDGSIEAEGDIYSPIEAALADPAVGIVGPFGIVTENLRDFTESRGPDVDAIEGYLMAFRHGLLERGLRFDERFRFYRSADIDLSFAVKDQGLAARVVPLPVRRHRHRRWEETPPEERDRLSKRNFYKFLDRWRHRHDLTVAGAGT